MNARTRWALVALVVLPIPSTAVAQNGYDLFQQALVLERSNGQVGRAIELYRQIIDGQSSDRGLTARALVRLGRAYETLGSQEARRAYERVVRDFAEQTESVAEARTRLESLVAPAPSRNGTGPVAELLLTQGDIDMNSMIDIRPSPDGHTVVYSAMGNDGALYLRDLESGVTTRFADGFSDHSVWSPDGNRIAYSNWGPPMVLESGEPRLVIQEVGTATGSAMPGLDTVPLRPLAWSGDGEFLIAGRQNVDSVSTDRVQNDWSLVRLTVASGQLRDLVPGMRIRPSAADISPDGRWVAFIGLDDGRQNVYVVEVATGDLHPLTSTDLPDDHPFWSPDGTTVVYQNPDGVWAVPVDRGRAVGTHRPVRSEPFDMPMGWTASGGFYYTAENAVQTAYAIPVDPASARPTGTPQRLPIDITSGNNKFAWSPDMRRLAFASNEPSNQQLGIWNVEDGRVTTQTIGSGGFMIHLWWSLDGRKVLFVPSRFQADGEARLLAVKSLDATTGEIRDVFPPFDDRTESTRVHVTADERHMVFYRGRPDSRVRDLVVSSIGNPAGVVVASDDDADGILSNWVRPQFSPDGSRVLFGRQGVEGPYSANLWVGNADGANVRKVADAPWITMAEWHPSGRFVAYSYYYGELEDLAGWTPGTQAALAVVDVETGESDVIDLPPDLGDVMVRDWSPDGHWIGVTGTTGGVEFWVVHDLLGDSRGSGRR